MNIDYNNLKDLSDSELCDLLWGLDLDSPEFQKVWDEIEKRNKEEGII